MRNWLAVCCAWLVLLSISMSVAEVVPLLKDAESAEAWKSYNGQEFPGAVVKVAIDPDVKHNNLPSLRIDGDFTNGGNYVEASVPVGSDITTLSFWIRYPGAQQVTTRLIDATGQCHQIVLKINASDDWQHISFPVADFFAKRGLTSAVQGVAKYESWGGAKDGKWHAPAKSFHVLTGKTETSKTRSIWLSEVQVATQPAANASVAVSLPLDPVAEGEPGWNLSLGEEFKGAKGSLSVEKDQPEPGQNALKLSADFTEGGAYVETGKDLKPLELKSLKSVKIRVKTDNVSTLTVRLIDGSGQVHQAKGFKVVPDGKWQDLVLDPAKIVGGEHWNGANDGKWHAGAQYVSILANTASSPDKKPVLLIASATAEGEVAGRTGASAYTEAFEAGSNGWQITGDVAIDPANAFKSKQSLVLKKTEATLRADIRATGPSFPVTPGAWEIKFATQTDLTSMDNSYNGSLALELLDGGGAVTKSIALSDQFRKNNWRAGSKQIEIPAGVTAARFRAQINKETPGSFWIDELSAAPMVVVQKDDRIKRIMFSTSQLGNLLFPESSREIGVTVLASKALPENQRQVSVVVKDYFGAEQSTPVIVPLERKGTQADLLAYEGKFDLSAVKLEIGRYYELHGTINREGTEPFKNYTSLAILPEAPANSFKPEEIPFTSRNWDNRIEAYVRLTHRLGIRICGVWGKFKAEPPYENEAPQLKLVQELGMGWLTGSPASAIESRSKGWEKYDEKALREGMRKFIADYGHVRPMIVNLGNEPHNKGDAVLPEVNAYRILYDEIKKIDPTITVVGTSIGTVEDWFKAGFGEWCDAYDFHVYEDALSVRKTVEVRYPERFKQYGHAKPVWSTELGLNSQGLSRQTVASELHKKFSNFFAGGGANVSWFGLLYPDKDGTDHDSFGSAHNVFDCRYNRYAPKLDAIAYYNSVNSILNKKFVEDRVYGTDTHSFLFRSPEGESLQVMYKDKGREDAFIPLPGVAEVSVIRLDGQRRTFDAGGKGITLTINEDPILLTYSAGPAKLPETLGKPAITIHSAPASIVRTEKTSVDVIVNEGTADAVSMTAQPFWTVEKEAAGNAARFVLVAPAESEIRELDTAITITNASGKPAGEIYYRPAVTGTMSISLLPVPVTATQPAAVKIVVSNNSPAKQDVAWDLTMLGEQAVENGQYGKVAPATAYFADTPSGLFSIEGKNSASVIVPLADFDLNKIYRVKATAKDASGRVQIDERQLAGLVSVPKVKSALTLDGKLEEAGWQGITARRIDKAEHFFDFGKKVDAQTWNGPDDLSADIKWMWDDTYLYAGIVVTDDIAGPVKADYDVWQQDGLQFLVDPMRTSSNKVGKYDYAVGEKDGAHRVKCYLAADGSVQLGDVTTWKVSSQRSGAGNITYEIAIPWASLLPFKPAIGADLGMTLILNEDDGKGRDSFMTWFGNAHNKDIDKVSDLILAE